MTWQCTSSVKSRNLLHTQFCQKVTEKLFCDMEFFGTRAEHTLSSSEGEKYEISAALKILPRYNIFFIAINGNLYPRYNQLFIAIKKLFCGSIHNATPFSFKQLFKKIRNQYKIEEQAVHKINSSNKYTSIIFYIFVCK